jgi:hypothetical protein
MRAKNNVDHPAAVYVREELPLPDLDAWLARKFSSAALLRTARELEAAQPNPGNAAQCEITEYDARLA